MDNIWQLYGLYFGLNFLGICSGHPIDPKDVTDTVPLAGPLLGFALLAASIICLTLCVCCRQQQRKGFKPNEGPSTQEFTDTTSNQSLNHVGRGFTNPGLTPGSELSIFPPPGAVSVTFEPLPNIVPSLQTVRSRKPPAYNNMVADGLSDTDWFMGPQIDFPRQQLHYLRECGRGWFGRVVEGEAKGLKDNRQSKVFVKILREDATQTEQKFFLNEVKPYRDLDHLNVLKLVGRCLETNPYLILLEACTSGDLKSFLAGNVTSSTALVQQGICLRMMCQVASGLQHMVQHGFVHTDLAARNCLVTSDLTVKVGDYGTSIETFKSDYYITEDVAIPIRWCSPETLHCTDTTIETKPVTVAANIWSLGVVLWEICEFGQLPYNELTDDQVIIRVLCQEGVRLGCPTLHSLHSTHLYTLMQMCWQLSSKRPSIEHILAMLLHLQTSTVPDSDEDFERRWETLKPNTIPITDNHVPEVTLETLTVKSDFDSGVDLEIKAMDPEVVNLTKRLSVEGVYLSPSITASPQLSVTSSSGGEFFTSSGLSTMQRHLSPSMTNLRGSIEDITKPIEEKSEIIMEEFDSWLKGVDTTSEEDVKFVKKISEAIRDLDDALALEKTSSSEDSSRQESPLKDSVILDENPILDFRLGPIPYKDSGMQLDSLQEDSFIRRDSSTDTEEETWRGRIERGEFSEKVKEKSRSVADLMILTHIENSDGSDESDSLPSLTRQYSIEKVKKFGIKPSSMMTSIGFGSEGNIRGAVLGEDFQESLKQLQAEWKTRESESRETSLLEPETSLLLQKDKLNFLSNDASEKTNSPVNNSQVKNIVNKTIVPSHVNVNILQKDSSVPIIKEINVYTQNCKVLDDSKQCDNTSDLYSKVSCFIESEKAFVTEFNSVTNHNDRLKCQSNENDCTVNSVINLTEVGNIDDLNRMAHSVEVVGQKHVSGKDRKLCDETESINTNQIVRNESNIETQVGQIKDDNGDKILRRDDITEKNNTNDINSDVRTHNVETEVPKITVVESDKVLRRDDATKKNNTIDKKRNNVETEVGTIKMTDVESDKVLRRDDATEKNNTNDEKTNNIETKVGKITIVESDKVLRRDDGTESNNTNEERTNNVEIEVGTIKITDVENDKVLNRDDSTDKNNTNEEKSNVETEVGKITIVESGDDTTDKNNTNEEKSNVETEVGKITIVESDKVLRRDDETEKNNINKETSNNIETKGTKIIIVESDNVLRRDNATEKNNTIEMRTNNVETEIIKITDVESEKVLRGDNATEENNTNEEKSNNIETVVATIKMKNVENGKVLRRDNVTGENNTNEIRTNNVGTIKIADENCRILIRDDTPEKNNTNEERTNYVEREVEKVKETDEDSRILIRDDTPETNNTDEINSDVRRNTTESNIETKFINTEFVLQSVIETTQLENITQTNTDFETTFEVKDINDETSHKVKKIDENTNRKISDPSLIISNVEINIGSKYTKDDDVNKVQTVEDNSIELIDNLSPLRSKEDKIYVNNKAESQNVKQNISEHDMKTNNTEGELSITDGYNIKDVSNISPIISSSYDLLQDNTGDSSLISIQTLNSELKIASSQNCADELKDNALNKTLQDEQIVVKNSQTNITEDHLSKFERSNVEKFNDVACPSNLDDVHKNNGYEEIKEPNKTNESFQNSLNFTSSKTENETVFPKVPEITILDDNSHFTTICEQLNFNKSDIYGNSELNNFDDTSETKIIDGSMTQTTNFPDLYSKDALYNTRIINHFVPEIVVTEASILDVDSEPEETIPYQNVSSPKRKIRIMVSSSDDSEDELDLFNQEFTESSHFDNDLSNSVSDTSAEPLSPKNKLNCYNDVDPTFLDSTETFVVPLATNDKFKPEDENESCVILGSCEDYTLDYFKGLKTTFGKPTIDVDSNDELSKSDIDENDDKEKMNNWDDFLNRALVDDTEEKLIYSDIKFRSNNVQERNDNIDFESNKTYTKMIDSIETPKKTSRDFILNEILVDLNKCDGDELSRFGEVCFSNGKNFVNDFPSYEVRNIVTCNPMDNMFDGLNSKDMQMEEVKNRLEDVAKFSQGFCLKGPSTSVEDEEDAKFLTPDDERSSDSGFRDKGSLSESVEDACDEKYNLEDIEAELEEAYSKNIEIKSNQDSPSSTDEQDKTFIISQQSLLDDSGKSNNSLNSTFIIETCNDNMEEKVFHIENTFKNDKTFENITELQRNNDLIGKEIQSNKTVANICLDPEEVFCLSSEEAEKSVDFLKNRNHDEDRFNKLDSALDSDIDLFFESKESEGNSGWYLHPPAVSEKSTYFGTKNEESNGWLPAPVISDDTCKDNSYVSFHIDEEFVTAIRNELREKLPCAQNAERQESEEDISPEEERTDMVIQYNTYPAALSPIFEERESLSSNQSSLLLDDQKSSNSSGKSSPILYLDLPKEIENSFEDVIRDEIDVDSDSTESDTAVIVVEDLEQKETVKVSENLKEDCDDLLIIDTETNFATLLESPKPKSQLAFVKQIYDDDDNSSGVNSDTYVLARLGDESDKQTLYSPDSVSPLSSGSSRTGAAISFSSSETGNLSGFYLSPSSVRSDLFDSGPPSLPFDLGQTFDTVEEISIKPNNEAAEIVQELVDIGVIKESDLTNDVNKLNDTIWNVENLNNDKEVKVVDVLLKGNGIFTNKVIPHYNDTSDSLISCKKSPLIESQSVQNIPGSQNSLQSILLPDVKTIITKDEAESLTSKSWPTVDELLPIEHNKTEPDLTPDSPCVDLNEIVSKCDINSTLALATPNFSILSDESKDNSQLSSFSSTPTLDTVRSISEKSSKESFSENIKSLPVKSVVPLSVLAENIVQRNETVNVNVHDVTPEEERVKKLQGMTLALEPISVSKAPMPSPEDADKGLWRPTIGQLLELTNQQDDMMTTSFIDTDNNDGERYTPDWESDTSDESEEHSSSSGEFIWKEGDREEAVRAVLVSTSDLEGQEGEEDEGDVEGRDDSSCGSTTEFVPSSWDSSAIPTKSALRSADKTSSKKKNVWFKLQKYHCVYEYPKEASESEDEEDDDGSRRRTWQTPTFDYSTYADWELGEGEIEMEGGDSDNEEGAAASVPGDARQPPEYDFYRLSGLDFDVGYMTSDDGEFYISSSAKPFHQFLMDDTSGSEFFPGAKTETNDDFIVEFNPLASDLQPVLIDSDRQANEIDETENITKKKTISPTKPNNLYIPPELSTSEESSSAEVSPGLGELRHTRQRLKLDLLGTVKGVAETVKGEASLLDSGEESVGLSSGQVKLQDSVESSTEA